MPPPENNPVKRHAQLLVVLDSSQTTSLEYRHYLQPYLDHFGFAYREIDVGVEQNTVSPADYAAVVLSHRNCICGDFARSLLSGLGKALASGCGLISFDASAGAILAGIIPDIVYAREKTVSTAAFTIVNNSHYITCRHEQDEAIALKSAINCSNTCRLIGGEPLVEAGGAVLLEAVLVKDTRVVLWQDCRWMSHAVLGPLCGMDDLLWRSIVWAAAKPFPMLGLPHFVTMRVDDTWGSSRSGLNDDPLYWVGVSVEHGFKPWLGLFLRNMSDPAIRSVRRHVEQGTATAFPHAFSGNERHIDGTPYVEEWIYFDHRRQCEYSDETMARNAARVEEWHCRHRVPIGRMALPHYFEMGRNALPYLLKWGCEFVGTHMAPGEPYYTERNDRPWLNAGPHRKFERGTRAEWIPVSYADWLTVDDRPDVSGKFFNCLTEIRDRASHEWAPNNDVAATVDRAVRQLRRALDSHCLASLYTHESDFLQNIKPENWQAIMEGIASRLRPYAPQYVTTENGCRHVRARNGIRVLDAMVTADTVTLEIEGSNDMPTTARLFLDAKDGGVDERDVTVPTVAAKTRVVVTL